MSDEPTSRKKFLQMLCLAAGATIVSKSGLAKGFDPVEIRKLTPEQQKFMGEYEKWMDEFTKIVRVQKTAPEDMENHKRMIALTEQAEKFQLELDKHLQDATFAFIFRISIERMTNEIEG